MKMYEWRAKNEIIMAIANNKWKKVLSIANQYV